MSISKGLFVCCLPAPSSPVLVMVTRHPPQGVDLEHAMKALRMTYEGEEALKVYEVFRSHASISRKNRLMLIFLDDIRQANAEVRIYARFLSF